MSPKVSIPRTNVSRYYRGLASGVNISTYYRNPVSGVYVSTYYRGPVSEPKMAIKECDFLLGFIM